MNFARTFGALAMVTLLAACASGPKMAEIQSSIPSLKANEGRIYFYRSSSMMGAGLQPNIVLNGEVVGESKPGGFFFVDQAPGDKQVSTSTEVEKRLTFTLNPGETRYVKTSVGFGLLVGRVIPELVDKSQAEGEIKDTSYTGKPLK